MKLKQDLLDYYNKNIETYSTELSALKKQKSIAAYGRAMFFLLAVACSFLFDYKDTFLQILLVSALFLSFFYLVALNIKQSKKIALLSKLIEININETAALNNDFSSFHSGEEYTEYDHPFCYDLDIFGDSSIYRFLNRCCTNVGRNKLADKLKNPYTKKTIIIATQQAVAELKEKVLQRQLFQATGSIALDQQRNGVFFQKSSKEKKHESQAFEELTEWLNQEIKFANKKWLKYILTTVPFVSGGLLIAVIAGMLSFSVLTIWIVVLLSIMALKLKDINNLHNRTGQKFAVLKNYADLLNQIENEKFNANKLQQLQQQIAGEQSAGKSIKQLASHLTALDNRLNIIFAIIANGLFLWDLQYAFRIEKWQQKHKKDLPLWFNTLAEFDALCCFANFAYNHPSYCFPDISDTKFVISLKEAGHPLIAEEHRVNNNFELKGKGNFSIVTGANMAGKSTFLRTVGVNIILAGCGSVVCAQAFTFSPLQMHTSIRANDSLQKNESYFYAELKRLHSIMERLEEGEELFIIIDEMLRGTNSKDKHHGSYALSVQLSQQNAIGLIATHDIGLGELANQYPDKIKNNRFEVEIADNKLHFDYKLQTGVSQNLNATFLMKKMGIIKDTKSL